MLAIVTAPHTDKTTARRLWRRYEETESRKPVKVLDMERIDEIVEEKRALV